MYIHIDLSRPPRFRHFGYIHMCIYMYIYTYIYIYMQPQTSLAHPVSDNSDIYICVYSCIHIRIYIYTCSHRPVSPTQIQTIRSHDAICPASQAAGRHSQKLALYLFHIANLVASCLLRISACKAACNATRAAGVFSETQLYFHLR